MKIVNSVDDETPPMSLNATSASGNHTSGDTGRSTCTIGIEQLPDRGARADENSRRDRDGGPSVKPIAIRRIDASTWNPMPGTPSTFVNAVPQHLERDAQVASGVGKSFDDA